MLRVQLLGSFQVERDGVALTAFHSQKTQSLFAYLMIYRGRAHPRSFLAGLLWGDCDEPRARANLRGALYWLRKALEGPYLLSEGASLRFNTKSEYSLDVEEFERKLEDAAHGKERARLLQEAVALYQGDLLPGFYDDWVVIEQEHLRELYLHTLKELAAHHAEQQDYPHAIEWTRRALTENPLQEDLHRALMQLYALVGNRSAALQQYAECAAILQRELTATPLPETHALYQRILQGRPLKTILEGALELPTQAPFIGRERELEALNTLWHQVHQGQGQAVFIGGEVGVGKTSCVQRFIAHIQRPRSQPLPASGRGAEGRKGVCILQGAAYASGHDLPYHPLLQAVRAGLKSLSPQTLAQLPALWRSELAQFLPEVQEQFPDLKPNPQLPPIQGKARWFAALTGFFELLARECPAILFLDDLHWADEATLEYLGYLTAHLKDHSILLIGAYRTEEAFEGSRLRAWLDKLGPGRAYHALTLARLSKTETDLWLQKSLGCTDQSILQILYDETEGNPLFLTELVRSLVQSGALLQGQEGRWQLAPEEISSGYWPENLRELVGASLRRAPSRAQSLLSPLSVIGRAAELPVLQGLLHQPQERILHRLDELRKVGLLMEREGRYQFSHELIRQAVYESLGADRKKLWHRQVARTLERLYPDRLEELSGELARHFEYAQLWKKAVSYAEQAGIYAQNAYAHNEAVKFFAKALKLCQQLKDRHGQGQNLNNMGKVWVSVGQYTEALRCHQQALTIYQEIPDQQGQGRSWNNIGVIYQDQGKYEDALRCYHQALEICRQAQLRQGEGILVNNIGNISHFLGNYEEALVHYREALEVRRALGDRRGEGIVLDNMGATYQCVGRYEEALRLHQQALGIRQELSDRWGEGDSLGSLGLLYLSMSRYEEASRALQQALEICQEIGDRRGQGYCLHNLSQLWREQGEFGQALKHCQLARAIFEGVGLKAEYLLSLSAEGITHLGLNDLEPALTCSSQAIELLEGGQSCAAPHEISFNHFRILAAHGRNTEAHQYFQKAYDEVMSRADKITDRETRESFLTNVPINRQIAQAWEAVQQKNP